jgi:hypothetical protein
MAKLAVGSKQLSEPGRQKVAARPSLNLGSILRKRLGQNLRINPNLVKFMFVIMYAFDVLKYLQIEDCLSLKLG